MKILLLFFITFTVSATEYGNATVSEVRTIYDGDSFRADINDWADIIGKSVPIRILGVDTPEMRGKCEQEKFIARQAKQHAVALLRAGRVIELTNIQRGKYFRILANVIIDGESLGDSLLSNGLARAYDGGKRAGWC
ncbi:micrococcal nuclease [Bathymodiolus japonicus methanotrophic gill symbiont]|uniref:thermonuclease family protein n=1 Tax=Bathymodiolus japonicus methanotrophic gill symbiont TaxID=113269 RepID=UPI001B4BFAD0|nr:thermonuclease family protein [Bathymodiolus japonicus methanotrophic gill symbiont]GFO71605.1 micrococcal nuclease [Bathymodiolus japonicus methanotrophic gill symbiont]